MSYGVYVAKLKPAPGPPTLGHLYVGSTAHDFEHRLEQHRTGHWTCSKRIASDRFVELRPELFAFVERSFDRLVAYAQERSLAKRLGDAGFYAWCDGVAYWREPTRAHLFDATELAAAAPFVQQHTLSVVASQLRPLSIDEIVRVLRWDRSYSVSDLVRTPSRDVGRFAHAEAKAVRDLVEESLELRAAA